MKFLPPLSMAENGRGVDRSGNRMSEFYRFASVGQDTQLLLWELSMEDLILPPSKAQKKSTKLSAEDGNRGKTKKGNLSQPPDMETRAAGNRLNAVLLPSPARKDVLKFSPSNSHKVKP